jgi:hypothetical protein
VGTIGEMTLEEAASQAAGNWQRYSCFRWDRLREIDDPDDWVIIYTHHGDSGQNQPITRGLYASPCQAQLDLQRMHAGTTAAARHEESAAVGDRAATGLQCLLSLAVGQAIATGLGPWGRVQSIVEGTQEQLHQKTAQRSEELPRGLLKFQQGSGRRMVEAEADHPVKLGVELLPELIHSQWTSRGRGTILALAHRGRLLIVPARDLFSDQDKPPGPQIPLDPQEK